LKEVDKEQIPYSATMIPFGWLLQQKQGAYSSNSGNPVLEEFCQSFMSEVRVVDEVWSVDCMERFQSVK
jgi:hypothetical protein